LRTRGKEIKIYVKKSEKKKLIFRYEKSIYKIQVTLHFHPLLMTPNLVNWKHCGINHPPPSSAEIKERVELYLYFPSGPSWPVVG
jgi:hypothetical protein